MTPRVEPRVTASSTFNVPLISVLPDAARIDALTPAAPPTEKLPPTNAFFLTDKPPSVDTDAEASEYPVESVTLSACTRPANVALPDVTSIPPVSYTHLRAHET